jgi:two-component system sensor histidine kinase ArlS
MTLKSRISFFISTLFTILFGVACTLIILIFSHFRKEEFKARLEEKAMTTIKLLTEVKEVDNQNLKVIDRNAINRLYDEKTLVFNHKDELIYSSLDDTRLTWTKSDLEYLRAHKTFFKKEGDYEIYGVYHISNGAEFFALISANDNYGKRKLEFLIYLLLGAYVLFTVATWILTFYVVKRQVAPLDYFHKNISTINENNLEKRLSIKENSKNEIDLIGKEFNFMMNRIEEAYQKQKEFTAQASHELRTPLARMSVQIENQLLEADPKEKEQLLRILDNISQLNDLINSLLLLSKADSHSDLKKETARIDEAIYSSIEKTHLQFNDFKVVLDIADNDGIESLLEQHGNQHLLEIAFSNLLKNAYLYSDNHQAHVRLKVINHRLAVEISNTGNILNREEQKRMFQPFMRGSNAASHNGLGLGLRIVQRILNIYNYKISYQTENNINQFIILF